MWADNETDEDLLGFAIHADLVKSIVIDPEMLPVTVGLFGDWGGGKSSILKLLQRDLSAGDEDNPETIAIYFDTWVFQGFEDAKTAILAVLLQELKEHRALKNKIFDEASDLLRRVNWMKVAKMGLAAGASYLTANPMPFMAAMRGSAPAEAKAEDEKKEAEDDEKWLRDAADSACDVKTFRRDFAKMMAKTSLKSLVVLIDDLDRCSPERVIENLEAIKLFLNVRGMAFVIAADRRIVENAIRVRYADALNTPELNAEARENLVTDYLEKLVQVPYTLPKLAPHEVRSYLSLLLFKKSLPAERFKVLLEQYSKFIEQNRYEPFDLRKHLALADSDPLKQRIEETLVMVETCSDPITDALKGNPRQIKRFLNTLWMRLQLAKVAKLHHLDQSVLIKLMVLEYLDDERLKEVYEWHRKSADGTAQPFEKLEAADNAAALDEHKNWQRGQLTRWLRAAPMLASIDLRDYFWLSRSTLDHTFAGVQMLSQAARQCLQQLMSGDLAGRKAAVELYRALGERERQHVASGLGRIAFHEPEKPEALQALFELATSGDVDCGDALVRVLTQADPDRLNLRVVHGLAALQLGTGKDSIDRLLKVRDTVVARKGKFGVALGRALTKK